MSCEEINETILQLYSYGQTETFRQLDKSKTTRQLDSYDCYDLTKITRQLQRVMISLRKLDSQIFFIGQRPRYS